MKYEKEYIRILKEELKPVNGCTEPVSIAYISSLAYRYLGEKDIVSVHLYASRSIIKNVKSVTVPNTNGLRGVRAACAIGISGGNPDKKLLCIADADENAIKRCNEILKSNIISVRQAESDYIFDLDIIMKSKNNEVEVRIVDDHENVVLVKKNNSVIFQKEISGTQEKDLEDKNCLNVEDIYDFASNCKIDDIKDVIETQINCNMAIAKEGLKNNYGANIGKTLLASRPNDVLTRAKAYTAAGSDARMNGCNMPVVINSGSGNQGMTCSIPVIIYAEELKVSHEKLLRALVLSNLLTLHVKEGIGILSAYCGAIAAGACAGAAIGYLYGRGVEDISAILSNSLAIASGTICDGAKASCAAKISVAVDSGIFGLQMFLEGNEFKNGDGIVKEEVEDTITNVGLLASEGMVETDKEIVKIMLSK